MKLFRAVLLGTAIGDALGVPFEGMRAEAIARRAPALDRFALLGRRGFVSDDTEQSALVAMCLARHPTDRERCVRAFRRALLGWLARLPWGIGGGTLRACIRIALGMSRSGVRSAGNGAAMRAAIVGAFFRDAPREERFRWSDALAEVTHVDPRAVEGARFVAEVAAIGDPRAALVALSNAELRAAIERALALADARCETADAARVLGATGYSVSSVSLATFLFARYGGMRAIREAVRAGGDADTNAAIVGAWIGARDGEGALDADLVAQLHDGPFGRKHLEAIAADLARACEGGAPAARYAWPLALARNVALFPVVLFHAFRVLASRVTG